METIFNRKNNFDTLSVIWALTRNCHDQLIELDGCFKVLFHGHENAEKYHELELMKNDIEEIANRLGNYETKLKTLFPR